MRNAVTYGVGWHRSCGIVRWARYPSEWQDSQVVNLRNMANFNHQRTRFNIHLREIQSANIRKSKQITK